MSIEDRLKTLNIELPEAAAPAANYIPTLISGNTLYISGQLPMVGSDISKGLLGDIDIETGQAAAKLCAINILAQVKSALGSLEKISRCIKLGGFVASKPDFVDHPKVINGASDFMVEVLEERGKHTRFAVGVSSLPFGASVEIDALFEIL